jgi:MoaA/NifB/PqqE/SkfB family radical SAM enzyme
MIVSSSSETVKIKNLCDGHGITLFVAIGIDGTEAENDRQRGVAGGYKKAFKTIGMLRDNGISPVVSTTVSKINVFNLERFLAVLNREGLKGYFKPSRMAGFFKNDSAI